MNIVIESIKSKRHINNYFENFEKTPFQEQVLINPIDATIERHKTTTHSREDQLFARGFMKYPY